MCVFRQMSYEIKSNGSSSAYDEIMVISLYMYSQYQNILLNFRRSCSFLTAQRSQLLLSTTYALTYVVN